MFYSVEDFEKLFDEMDQNGDKGISCRELEAFLKAHKIDFEFEDLRKLYRKYDINRNGKFEKDEFVELCLKLTNDRI